MVNNKHRELFFKQDDLDYAQVQRRLDNIRCEALCLDNKVRRICLIHPRRNLMLATGDIILVRSRTYPDARADVILKYTPNEAKRLMANGELPKDTELSQCVAGEEDEDGEENYIEFLYSEVY